MLRWLSDRSLHVMMLAYFAACSRGAGALELEDVLWAIITEDQGRLPCFAGALRGAGSRRVNLGWGGVFKTRRGARPEPRSPFFSSDVAREALGRIEGSWGRPGRVPSAGEMAASDGVKRALARASRVTRGLRRKRIEPLHLLEAIGADEGSKAGAILNDSGVTRDAILKALRGDSDGS